MIERKPPRSQELSPKALQIGAMRHAIFARHVKAGEPVTASAVAEIALEIGLKERAIRTLAKRYQANPVAASLAPQPKGPKPGSHHFDEEVLAAIDVLANQILLVKLPPSDAECARQIWALLVAQEGEYRFSEDRVPSERVIVRMLGEISERTLAAKTMGSKSRSAHELHAGQYESGGLLDVVQMDHTKGDVILVDRVHRLELGRPWITLLIDIWTRCILGFYVSFGDPSIYRCGRAVANAILPKEPLLRRLGVNIDYPMHGLFAKLHADQAKPHRAEVFREACLHYGIDPDVRKPGPAYLGGHIERLIGTMVGKLRLLPGSTGSNVTQRDGYDAGDAAAMTLPEFERWFLYQIAIYHEHPHSALGGRCPAQAWREAVAFRGLTQNPPVNFSPEHLSRKFLPRSELTVRSKGVQILHRFYSHPVLATRIGQKIMVHKDETTIQHVFAEIDGEFVRLDVTGFYPDVSEAEWEAARARVRAEGKVWQADGGRARTARYVLEAKREVDTAIQKTRAARATRKRAEGEGTSAADLRLTEKPAVKPVIWKPVAELGDDWARIG